jgi:hypothetical protein
VDGKAIGTIDVAAMARAATSTPQTLVEAYVRELQRNKVGICTIPIAPCGSGGSFQSAWEGRTEALNCGRRLDLRIYVGRNARLWFAAGLTGPARAADPSAWMLNTRGWDVLVGNLCGSSGQPG